MLAGTRIALTDSGRPGSGLKRMRFCRLSFLVIAVLTPACLASVDRLEATSWASPSFANRQLRVGSSFHHLSGGTVLRTAGDASCEVSKPPLALATPDPLVSAGEPGGKVAVSFIVGTDGRVHSPVILESSGPVEERRVLEAVRSWRYRPAMCNAAPAEVESKVEFSER